MKRFMRFLMRTIPRPVLIRFSKIFSIFIRLAYIGNKVECPICEGKFRKLLPYGIDSRENVLCPKCLSLERHRLIWLYLKNETQFFSKGLKIMHVAPEQCFYPRFKKLENIDYLTVDLESPLADMHFDIHDIPLEDKVFDMVMCNHVLEHVVDDHRVMTEIYRVLKPGGMAILQVPQDYSLDQTYEDSSITSPGEREIHFKQKDHLRLYGLDYPQRLRNAGFEVDELSYAQNMDKEQAARACLATSEILYIAKKVK
jgi:SAM-dependent methyltransferase